MLFACVVLTSPTAATMWTDANGTAYLGNERVGLIIDTVGPVLLSITVNQSISNATQEGVEIIRSFHRVRADNNPAASLYNDGTATKLRVLLHDHCFVVRPGRNDVDGASLVLETCENRASPGHAALAEGFIPLGNTDFNDPNSLVRIGASRPLVSDALACEAICATIPHCVSGTYINGTIRHGECWLASKMLSTARHDFCGLSQSQQCYAFAKSTKPPTPPSPGPQNSTSVLKHALMEITLLTNDTAFGFDITASIAPTGSVSAGLGLFPLEYLLSAFEWAGQHPPQFVHTPQLKRVSKQHWGNSPSSEYVSGDRTWGSPITVLESEVDGTGVAVALTANTQLLNAYPIAADGTRSLQGGGRVWPAPASNGHSYLNATMPLLMDVQTTPPVGPGVNTVFSYGFGDYEVEQHVYMRHYNDGSMVRQLQNGTLRYGFTLLARHGGNTRPSQRLYQVAAQRLWHDAGVVEFGHGRPQVMPFVDYARFCYPAALNETSAPGTCPPAYNAPAFVSFSLPDGSAGGGLRTMWGGGNPPNSAVFNKIHNVIWWNNVHMAHGFGLWGNHLLSEELGPILSRASGLIVNTTLSSPTVASGGLWDSVCEWNPTDKRCDWAGSLHNIGVPHTSACIDNPTCDPGFTGNYWNFASPWKSAASVSKTSVMLLRVVTDVSAADRLRVVQRVQFHADWLVKVVTSTNGSVPEWWVPSSSSDEVVPSGWLSFNAHGGIHMHFLAEFASILPQSERAPYISAARTLASFLQQQILPTHRWADTETFYSCSVKPESAYDNFTNQPPRNTLSTGWAVDGFASLFEVTGDSQFLVAAEESADYLSLYQAAYNPTFFERPQTAYVFGGMRSQNTDAEWLDMRQTVDAEGLVRLGNLSGRQDLMERGVAALRACFALITENRTQANGVYPVPQVSGRPNVPAGLEPENVDHEGAPQLPGRSGPDWGEVGCLAAAAYITHRFGGAYVDVARDLCLGIDGVALSNCSLTRDQASEAIVVSFESRSLLDARSLPVMPWEHPFDVNLVIRGLPPSAKAVTLVNNGIRLGMYNVSILASGVALTINPS